MEMALSGKVWPVPPSELFSKQSRIENLGVQTSNLSLRAWHWRKKPLASLGTEPMEMLSPEFGS